MNKATIQSISKSVTSGITPLRSNQEFWTNVNISWLKTNQIGAKYIYKTDEKISNVALEQTSIKVNPENTLSIAMYGEGKTRGNVSIIKAPMATNQACCNILLNKEIADFEYVYYFLKTQYENLRNLSSGVRKNLNSNDIKNFEIQLPEDVDSQKKLASVLSSIDKKIELNNRINTELEAMAKTLYDYWFVQFDFPNPSTSSGQFGKPYKSSGGKMVFNEVLKREIPEGWECGELGDWVSFQRGISYKSSEIQEAGVPLINLNSFYLNGNFKYAGTKYYTGTYKEGSELDVGDLVIAITDVTRNADIIGKSFLIPNVFNGESPLISCDVAKIISSNKLDNQYLEMLFNSDYYHDYIKYFASGTLVLHLNLDGVKWFKTFIPPKDILNEFSKTSNNILKMKTKNLIENQQLTQLRDWLLPMLMNGQVTVK